MEWRLRNLVRGLKPINYFMRVKGIRFLFICSFLVANKFSFAQSPALEIAKQIDLQASKLPKLQVYLQTSKGVYESGEDLWFKGYMMDSQYLTPSVLDTTLYVQLFEEISKKTIAQEKYFINSGFVNGHFLIRDTIPPGNYLLAAFSPYSFNGSESEFKAFKKITILQRIKQTSSAANTKRDVEVSKSALIKKIERIQFDLLPESGHLVNGLNCNIAFKAVNIDGLPIEINGMVYEDNKAILNFKSLHDGMGKFSITPSISNKYHVKLEGTDSVFKFPLVLEQGLVLQKLSTTDNSVKFLIKKTKELVLDKVVISVQIRSKVCTVYNGVIKNDSLAFDIPTEKLPQGIAEITIYDESGKPIAERLAYVNKQQKLNIKAQINKNAFDKKEKVELDIKVTDQIGNPIIAHLGLSVYDALYENPKYALDIISYMHLQTQLKGNIHQPSYYFENEKEDKSEALDLLLITQGWRRYKWSTSLLNNEKLDKPVLSNIIKGKIIGKVEGLNNVMFFTPDNPQFQEFLEVPAINKFEIAPADLLKANGSYVYVKLLGAEEKIKRAKTQLANPFQLIDSLVKHKSFNYPLNNEKEAPKQLPQIKGLIALNEVVLKSYGIVNNRDKYLGSLDSIAKFSSNFDYVAQCGWLNCPACGSGTKPIEGKSYSRYIGNKTIVSHPFSFSTSDIKKEPYQYPKYTDEELLAKFNLSRIKAYHQFKEFYQPNYDINPNEKVIEDFRNTLVWNPEVITNDKGEAKITFYTSDISGKFFVDLEGLDADGLLGVKRTEFFVTSGTLGR